MILTNEVESVYSPGLNKYSTRYVAKKNSHAQKEEHDQGSLLFIVKSALWLNMGNNTQDQRYLFGGIGK